jgi:arylsulfatase A-like enzyme
VRANGLGYPGRAIRTSKFLYIRNDEPDRWPAGDPPLFGDVDAHMLQYPSPTKMELLTRREDEAVQPLFDLAFAKRPPEELHDLEEDPSQVRNVAADPDYQERDENPEPSQKAIVGARRALHLRRTVRAGDPSCQTTGGLP